MDPRAFNPDAQPPTSPAQRSRYSPEESMNLYAAIVGPNSATDPQQDLPPASARTSKQRRIEQLLTDLDDQRLRELTHSAADRCWRQIGKVISRLSSWREKHVEQAKAHPRETRSH
jgi:hypothetical protein